MINIKINDCNGTVCMIGDVLMMHFKAERIKYIGVLKFDVSDYSLKIFFNETDWCALSEPGCTKFEALCTFNDNSEIKNHLGKIKLAAGKAGDKQLRELYKTFSA